MNYNLSHCLPDVGAGVPTARVRLCLGRPGAAPYAKLQCSGRAGACPRHPVPGNDLSGARAPTYRMTESHRQIRIIVSRQQKPARTKPSAPVGSLPYLLLMYSSMDLAALLPAPMARMTVAAPVAASPPAKMPGTEVVPSSLAATQPLRVFSRPGVPL